MKKQIFLAALVIVAGGAVTYRLVNQPPSADLPADKQMLEFLDSQTSLDAVLKHYGVNYLVTVNLNAGEQGCYSAREPAQNRFGGSNKGMSDWLCATPVFEKQATPKIKIGIFKINQNGKAVSE